MKNSFKQCISLILVVVMVLMMSGVTVFANENVMDTGVDISSNSGLNKNEVHLTNETEAFDLVFQPSAIKLDQKLRDPVKDALWEERYGVKTSASDNLLTDPATSTLETATGNTVILESSKEQSFSEMNLETKDSSGTRATPSLLITNRNANSISFDVRFPTSGQWGNCIVLINLNSAHTTLPSGPYDGNWYKGNGSYTINNLTPGGIYFVGMWWSTDGSYAGGTNAIYKYTHLLYNNNEQYSTKNGTYISAVFETADFNAASNANVTTWLSRMDNAYLALKDLTGFVPNGGQKLTMRSTRAEFPFVDGQNYWYLTWATYGNPSLFSQPFVKSHMLRLSNNDWGDAALHEMSHAFDNWAWTFDSEALADFKEYYVVETKGATVYRCDTNKYYTGSAFYNFFKTDQYFSYDNTFARGSYHSRGMTAVMIKIKNNIGWLPFVATFKIFNQLEPSQIPNSNIGKLNLFITLLKKYSGKSIIALLTQNEKNIIERQFGGSLSESVVLAPTSGQSRTMHNDNIMYQYTGHGGSAFLGVGQVVIVTVRGTRNLQTDNFTINTYDVFGYLSGNNLIFGNLVSTHNTSTVKISGNTLKTIVSSDLTKPSVIVTEPGWRVWSHYGITSGNLNLTGPLWGNGEVAVLSTWIGNGDVNPRTDNKMSYHTYLSNGQWINN